MIRYFLAALIAIALFFAIHSGRFSRVTRETPQKETIQSHSWTEALDFARKNLPQEGVLVKKSDGYVYLKVDDNYIHELFPLLGLQEKGYTKAPYFRSKEAPGAHISVFNETEEISPGEVGKTFTFKLHSIAIIKPNRNTKYVILQVKAPALEALRQKYGLNPKLQGHEFHITLAKKQTQ